MYEAQCIAMGSGVSQVANRLNTAFNGSGSYFIAEQETQIRIRKGNTLQWVC
jgi:hypothetical protein